MLSGPYNRYSESHNRGVPLLAQSLHAQMALVHTAWPPQGTGNNRITASKML